MQPGNIEGAYLNPSHTTGYIPVKSQHNEIPIGKFHPDILREWLDKIEETANEPVYLWTIEHPDHDDRSMLVATYGRDSDMAIATTPRRDTDE